MIGQKGMPASYGGVERHVEELATRLAKQGHQVFVYARNYYVSKEISEFKKVKIVRISTIKSKNLDAICHTFLASLNALRSDIDIIHYHGIGPASLLFIPKIFKPKVKIVVTFHTKDYLNPKWGFFARFYLKMSEKIMMRFADRIIVVSKNLKKYCQTKYQKEVYYIPNGISLPDLKSSSQEAINKLGLKKNNYILSVSRLVEQKGIHFLIKAYNLICQKNLLKKIPPLVIVGDPVYTNSYFNKLKKIANHNPKIIFLGSRQGKELQEIFANCFLYVNSSVIEGLSIALLEAMSYGKCVLTSDIPENLEVINPDGKSKILNSTVLSKNEEKAEIFNSVKNYGITFKNKDVENLAMKLEFSLNNSELIKEKGLQSQNYVIREYNWDEVAFKTIKVYESLTNYA